MYILIGNNLSPNPACDDDHGGGGAITTPTKSRFEVTNAN